jgi:putative ABC transport system permease protein
LGLFGLAGLISLAVAVLVVSWQSFKIARANPVHTLKYE